MPLQSQQVIGSGKLAVHSLFSRLNEVYAANCMLFGHHDSLAYGRSHLGWRANATHPNNELDFSIDKSDIAFALMDDDGITDAPSLYSWDLLGLEHISQAENIDLTKSTAVLGNGIIVKDLITWVKKVHRSGGVNMFCWHVSNPSNNATKGKGYGDTSNPKTIREIVTSKSSTQTKFNIWLKKAANFFLSLKDDNGLLIPVIFRPFHEMITYDHPQGYFTPFFWWNQISMKPNRSTPQNFKDLWMHTQNKLISFGATNLLYAFCVNDFFIDGATGQMFNNLQNLIPNSNSFDILSYDCYQRLNQKTQISQHPHSNSTALNNTHYDTLNFINRAIQQSNEIERMAIQLQKLPAITEIGASYFYDNPNWWTTTLQPIINTSQIAFLSTWRNPYFKEDGQNSVSDKSDYYSPYYNPTGSDLSDWDVNFVNDFIDFYTTNERVLFLNELNNPTL